MFRPDAETAAKLRLLGDQALTAVEMSLADYRDAYFETNPEARIVVERSVRDAIADGYSLSGNLDWAKNEGDTAACRFLREREAQRQAELMSPPKPAPEVTPEAVN